MSKPSTKEIKFEHNYLTALKSPPNNITQVCNTPRPMQKQFTYIKGQQSHVIRRRMILKDHPQIAKLLLQDKPYTIIIALTFIALNMTNCYLSKDMPMWFILLNAYALGSFLNHTLQICIHDLTHSTGGGNMFFNKFMAIVCNIPMGLPTAMSFGRYHGDHHTNFSLLQIDPDLPLPWEAKLSYDYPWYKYFFYSFIAIFYALRPVFMFNPTLRFGEIINYVTIFFIDFLIYHFWGGNALIFIIFSGINSIGPIPAAIHVIAQHYQFIKGLQSYDYIGWWNIPNLNVGYHIEHHDFPTCPWWSLPKIRKIAPEYYQYLPHHTSYYQILKNFLTDVNFNLYSRTIRIPEKQQ